VLNSVWKVVTKFKEPAIYMSCAEIWIELTSKEYTVINNSMKFSLNVFSFKTKELNTMLGDVIKHLSPDRAFEDYYPKLHAIMTKLINNVEDFASLFSMVRIICFFRV